MMSPHERYTSDPAFKGLVDSFEAILYSGDFCPSEVRLAAMLASINFQAKHIKPMGIDRRLIDSLEYIDSYVNDKNSV